MHNGHDCMCFCKNQTSEMVKIAYPQKLNPLKIPVIWYNVLLCVKVNLKCNVRSWLTHVYYNVHLYVQHSSVQQH